MKNILVTGGLGFIGSHTVVELFNAGYNPIIIDNLSNSKKSVLEGIAKITNKSPLFYQHDYSDKTFLHEIFETKSLEGVIHFAAYKAVGDSVDHPLKYYQNNIGGLINLLEFCEEKRVHNFIFSSSCTVYGNPEKLPATELTSLAPPTSPYGATKQMGEIILADTIQASKTMCALALRYFNPIGAHPSAFIGELPKGTPSCLVPYLVQSVAGLRSPLVVHGDDYPTKDGTCIRDYIHVVDLAEAHVKALRLSMKKPFGYFDYCNIGTGIGSSILDVIRTFQEATGKKVEYIFGPRRPGDAVTIYASAKKAEKLLGWRAKKTLADGLRDAWNWQLHLDS